LFLKFLFILLIFIFRFILYCKNSNAKPGIKFFKKLWTHDFQSKIKENGYYPSPKNYRTFREYTQKIWTIISTTNTSPFLSKDFCYEQATILTNNGFYIIRTGESSFAIFDEKIFSSHYLKFDIKNIIEIGIEECNVYNNLEMHLKKMFLKLMRL